MASPSFGPSQVPVPRNLLRGKIEVARILALSSSDFARLIEDLESSPIFQKLFSGSKDLKVIHRKSFNRAALAGQFYELPETLPSAPSGDVEKVLESKTHLVNLIRRIGQEKFERYFLHDNGELSPQEVAEACGLRLEEVQRVGALVNKVFLESEILQSPLRPAPAPQTPFSRVAQVLPDAKQGFLVAFTSPRMAQGTYQVDYGKLQKLRKEAALAPEEKRALNQLLSKISLINTRKNSLYQLLLKVIEFQAKFFGEEQGENLVPLTQRKVAAEIGASPSSVSRLIYARSLAGPSGKEYPLESFFLSRKSWLKRRLEEIFSGRDHLTDQQVQLIIKKQYGIQLSRRSVNQYRQEIRKGRR